MGRVWGAGRAVLNAHLLRVPDACIAPKGGLVPFAAAEMANVLSSTHPLRWDFLVFCFGFVLFFVFFFHLVFKIRFQFCNLGNIFHAEQPAITNSVQCSVLCAAARGLKQRLCSRVLGTAR